MLDQEKVLTPAKAGFFNAQHRGPGMMIIVGKYQNNVAYSKIMHLGQLSNIIK